MRGVAFIKDFINNGLIRIRHSFIDYFRKDAILLNAMEKYDRRISSTALVKYKGVLYSVDLNANTIVRLESLHTRMTPFDLYPDMIIDISMRRRRK